LGYFRKCEKNLIYKVAFFFRKQFEPVKKVNFSAFDAGRYKALTLTNKKESP